MSRSLHRLGLMIIGAGLTALTLSSAIAAEKCMDRRIVRFGETTKTIAQRCGVTHESIERQNPGLHTQGAQIGVRIKVPEPALPSPQIQVRGNSAISGNSRFEVPVMR